MTLEEVFKELDAAARANLTPRGVSSYETRKAQLLKDGLTPEDMDMTLRGFIWDESESETNEENPEE